MTLLRSGLLMACIFACVTATVNEKEPIDEPLMGPETPYDLTLTVREILTRQVNNMWVGRPGNTVCSGCLIDPSWLANEGSGMTRVFSVSNLESALEGLPNEIVSKVRMIAMSEKVNFEDVRYTLETDTDTGEYMQYLGLARRQGTQVQFALVRGYVLGRMIRQTQQIIHRVCKNVMWWTCCCKNYVNERYRGYTTNELHQIETALRAETVKQLGYYASRINF